jgi:hypothetical protein
VNMLCWSGSFSLYILVSSACVLDLYMIDKPQFLRMSNGVKVLTYNFFLFHFVLYHFYMPLHILTDETFDLV